MKACDDCRNPDGTLVHPTSQGCNWLNDQETCPHCDGPLRQFRGSALGDLMDEMATAPKTVTPPE